VAEFPKISRLAPYGKWPTRRHKFLDSQDFRKKTLVRPRGLHYNDSDVPHPEAEHLLELWKHNGSWYKTGWDNGKSLDVVNNTVSANITDFGSLFAPMQLIPPNITALKVAVDMNGPPLLPGNVICYTVWINNTGNGSSADNPGNEFEDPIPDYTSYIDGSATASSGTIEYNASNNTITWNGAIPANVSIEITFCVIVDLDVPPGTIISNQGTVNYDSTGDGSNDVQKPTDNPETVPLGDPTDLTTTVPVPVLTPVGVLALVGMLTIVSALSVKRRKREE